MYSELGFVTEYGEIYLRSQNERGHIEVAQRIISEKSLTQDFKRSCWDGNPVDYLIYERGALKIGNRYGDVRMILYYPPKLTKEANKVLQEYKGRLYKIETVNLPNATGDTESIVRYFHT